MFHVRVFPDINLWTDLYWYTLSLPFFLIAMREIDRAAEEPLEPFQTFMIEIFAKIVTAFAS